MNVGHSVSDLEDYLTKASAVSKDHPVVISKFILEAKVIISSIAISLQYYNVKNIITCTLYLLITH